MAAPPPYLIPPAGVSAASFFGTVAIDFSHPPALLADKIDPLTGELLSIVVGEDPIDSAVRFQVRVRRGSGAAVLEDGQAFDAIRKNDLRAADALRAELKLVLRELVDRGDIEILTVGVQAGEDQGDLGAVFFQYRNLRTGADSPRVFL